jgi:hypothetical protein
VYFLSSLSPAVVAVGVLPLVFAMEVPGVLNPRVSSSPSSVSEEELEKKYFIVHIILLTFREECPDQPVIILSKANIRRFDFGTSGALGILDID